MKKLVIGFCSFLIVAAHALSIFGADLRVSFPSPTSMGSLPLWVTKEAGLFQKNNLDVELVYVVSPLAINALFSNDIQIASGASVGLAALHAEGNRDFVAFASLNDKLSQSIYAQRTISNVEALRGKRFGVTRFGGVIDFASRYFLRSAGLDPQKDVTMIQVPSVPDLLRALVAGFVDAATLSMLEGFTAKKLGFRELADFAKTNIRYAGGTFVAKKQLLVENRVKFENFIKALIEGVQYTKNNRNVALKVFARQTKMSDLEVMGQVYDYHVQNIWPAIPEIKPEAMKLVIEQLSESNVKALGIDPPQLIYSATMENVIKAGSKMPVEKPSKK
jgi:NitT/TauT family transport system substrate-binding protein